ncbi:MAG: sigma 54-interacting transcriptional regulator [Polyangiaceae bacterium]|nr:sigma 54-interacting transcriptional regulator [Polyangiaceae bacterium]
MDELAFPPRYRPVACLGRGGGGQVWEVEDRYNGLRCALKVLSSDATHREMEALVREATALSGLEGLGVPRVLAFGRLPGILKPYLVRELISGQSLEEQFQAHAPLASLLEALAKASEQLTVLHRSGLLHGDVKPANIIVESGGRVTLVDLGLAAPWQEHGVRPEGLTPRYAAPELFLGKPLTVRAEVYALGVTLSEALEYGSRQQLTEDEAHDLEAVAQRAIAQLPSERYPSADEFASALRRAARLPSESYHATRAAIWPIVGIDASSENLRALVLSLEANEVLCVVGAPGSGRSALLRRLAWSLGLAGLPVTFIDEPSRFTETGAKLPLHALATDTLPFVLVDDVESLPQVRITELMQAVAEGARLVVVGGEQLFPMAKRYVVSGLDAAAARELVRRAVPALTERHLARIVEASAGRPGDLRQIVARIAGQAVVSADDIEAVLAEGSAKSLVPEAPLDRARFMLEKGRFNEVAAALSVAIPETADEKLTWAILQARSDIFLGEAARAAADLRAFESLATSTMRVDLAAEWQVYLARALIGNGECTEAVARLTTLRTADPILAAEARAYEGLGNLLLNQPEAAEKQLLEAVESAKVAGSARVEAIALGSLALVAQRREQLGRAKEIFERALLAAEVAGDAGMLANLQLNLAGLCKVQGDIAQAIERYESALDSGRRSGRRSAVRQALLNLANLDLYLGRLAKARSGIEALEQQRDQLPAETRAQLLGLQAELRLKNNELEAAVSAYEACAAAYDALGRSLDAAEARLESILAGARLPYADVAHLRQRLELARTELTGSNAHRPLFHLAEARIHTLAKDESRARASLDAAIACSRESGQREWVWRALQIRASLEEEGGQGVRARRDGEEALAVLEDIAAQLPRDLREVYWNDVRRRELRAQVQSGLAQAATEYRAIPAHAASTPRSSGTTSSSISQLSATPLEHRLARILEVNHELVGVWDLERLTARIIDSAVGLLRAEGGAVLLKRADGSVQLYTSRVAKGDGTQLEFSRSIAEKVIANGEPIVSLSARDDARMQGYASVHQMRLQSVACVPIRDPSGGAVGALYLETRLRPGAQFEAELPTLSAFADQMAIALENARLINENKTRADELELANQALLAKQAQISELLEERTSKLKQARRKLRDARDTLYGHFGYQGLVGTSAAMRKAYSLIERVKDADIPVLITGESGTGKEVVARAIHTASERSRGKLLAINCGAIPENLLETELFGHVRGAFTGADRDRRGLFREASGGSLLLDEIGDLPLKMQVGLLRVLQERTVRPVGGQAEEPVDVRVLFATNRDLADLVQKGLFREDLFYRIQVVNLHLPALRERAEDIPQLVDYFLGLFAARYKRDKKSVSREALRNLEAYHWPGNVRQLEHVLLNAWVMSDEDELVPGDFSLPEAHFVLPKVRGAGPPAKPVSIPSAAGVASTPEPMREPVTAISDEPISRRAPSQTRTSERDRMLEALRTSNWNRVRAAEIMGMPRRTFYRRLRDYGIQ